MDGYKGSSIGNQQGSNIVPCPVGCSNIGWSICLDNARLPYAHPGVVELNVVPEFWHQYDKDRAVSFYLPFVCYQHDVDFPAP